jgi:hypothetical protein
MFNVGSLGRSRLGLDARRLPNLTDAVEKGLVIVGEQ